MFKHLWVERGMLSGLTKKICILVIVILSSILADGRVQDTFAGETGEGEHERRSGDDWRHVLCLTKFFFILVIVLIMNQY